MKTVASAASIVAIMFFFFAPNAQVRAGQRESRSHVTVPASQVVNGDYFAFGGTVEIAGTINGDLYASGGQVVIDGTVNGDVLVAGGRVSLSGSVSQDVRAAGGQVTISGRLRPASSRASAFVLGLFVYYLLAIFPFIGWLVVSLVVLFGLGAELIARKEFYKTARTQGLI